MFNTLADVRAANAAIGNCWFSKDTMRFWKTRIESSLLKHKYFITSEDKWCFNGRVPQRIYAVRMANEDGSIKTLVSHLCSKADAKDYVRGLNA